MILINFSHPLTAEQTSQVEKLAKQTIQQVISIPVQFDNTQSFLPS
jgi:hypothetical protein